METDDIICSDMIDFKLPGGVFKYYEHFLSKELAEFYYETFACKLPFKQGTVSSGSEKRPR